MKLTIVSRSGGLFEGEVTDVVVPAYNGEMGILPKRSPILAVLNPGVVRFTTPDGKKLRANTGLGLLTVDNDEIMVVVGEGSFDSEVAAE
ncbi:MAG: F0F1 ATP synthase subunit epsilon [Actinomycetaceae bacterium]|nr:F0F1 ATP synthase subunit epsilon [Actinomycetaceae bacterium]